MAGSDYDINYCSMCYGFGILSIESDYMVWSETIVCPCCEGTGKKKEEK